jgi:hypothetical protein
MPLSAPRVVLAVIVAAIGIYFSVRLGMYAEADDAPGGVVIALVLLFGSVALGLWIALRPARNSSQ